MPAGSGPARVLGIIILVVVVLVGVYMLALYTDLGRRLVASLFPAAAPAAVPSGPGAIVDPGSATGELAPETWYPPETDASRCYIDLNPTATKTSALDGAEEINCRPRLPTRLPYLLFSLRRQSSSRGNTRTERVPCVNEAALPECCVPDRAGLQANADAAAAAEATPREAFGLLCAARYGCETDPVYARGMVPWLPQQPLNCFAEANTNTCVQLLTERVEPGTLGVNPAVRAPEQSRERLRFLCENDSRTTSTILRRGNEIPRMTPAELAAECRAQGYAPQANPAAGCPAAGAAGAASFRGLSLDRLAGGAR